MAEKHLLAPDGIACHAWNKDKSLIAVCPNNNEIHIFETTTWKRVHVLSEHDLLVSALDWSHVSNKIVSCSHDRNAFVWTLEGETWKPALVILRIDRAAVDVKWSSDGKRFAVASAAKCVPVCTYEEQNDWWVPKMVKKKFKSTVQCVAFHPTNGQLLATGSSDFKCRVYSTFSTDVDGNNVDPGPFGTPLEFGEAYCELSSLGWIHAVAWSPSGNVLAYAGHDSVVHFATLSQAPAEPVVRSVRLSGLPCCSLLFLSDSALVGAGHDFSPNVYVKNSSSGEWSFYDTLDKNKNSDSSSASISGSTVSSARELFLNKTVRGQESKDSNTLSTSHERAISGMRICSSGAKVTSMSTSGLDGNLVVWNLPSLEISMVSLGL